MQSKFFRLIIIVILALVTVACSGSDTPAPAQESEAETVTGDTTEADEAAVAEEVEDVDAGEPDDTVLAASERPAWQHIELTDARTGEAFTLADFAGKTVFVEPMATWCTNCRAQMGRVREARAQLDSDGFVFIGVSLEAGLVSDEELARYADNHGFDWTFAVLTQEALSALADTFGRSVTVAPSTPHFVIRPDGSYTGLSTGAKTVQQIVDEMLRESGA
jgi:peroxiredoxin